jgi:hypothetical protein
MLHYVMCFLVLRSVANVVKHSRASVHDALWKSKEEQSAGTRRSDDVWKDRPYLNHSKRNTAGMLLILRNWAPEYMPFSPFIACTIMGPYAVHVENCLPHCAGDGNLVEPNGLGLDIEMLKLCLKRHAWYWEIGSLLLS